MAYIGRDIEYGSFTKQTLTANSSTTVFALDQSVFDANGILVSVGGVIQEPDVAYTASGTVLTFTGTPVTGDPIWIVYLGKTLGTSTTRGAITYQAATGDGSATTVAMTSTGNTGNIVVTLNGVMQTPSTDFSVSGSTLTFTTAPFNNAAIGIHYLGKQARLGVPASGTIQQADLASSGTFPAWNASALTGIVGVMKADIFEIQNNIALLNFLRANDITAKRTSMLNGFQDQFRTEDGIVPFNGTLAVSAFGDASSSGHTVTAVGNTVVSSENVKIGNSSMYFDGSGDSLTIADSADFDFGTGDVTIEMWINSSNGAADRMISRGSHPTEWFLRSDSTESESWKCNIGGSVLTMNTGSNEWADGKWHHVAVCRDGATLRLYVDGVQKDSQACGTGTWSASSGQLVSIGTGANSGPTEYYHGFLDEVRISKTCRYPSGTTFTPSTTAFTSDANTELLVHSNYNNTQTQVAQSTGTIIASTSPITPTTGGLLFDGNRAGTNYSGAAPATGDYAGKDWGVGVTKTITGFKAWNNENTHGFNVGGSNIEAKLQGSSDGTTWVELGTTGSVADGQGQPFPYSIGKMNGVTTTTAYRYHRVLFNNTVDIRWSEIEFYEGTPEESIFTDSSSNTHAITAVGDAKHQSVITKFGTDAVYYDGYGAGNGNTYLQVTDHADFDFGTGDFTIESWVYQTASASGGANYHVVWHTSDTDQHGIGCIWHNDGTLEFHFGTGSWSNYRTTTTYSNNQWHHIAESRSGGTVKIFVNGVEVQSLTRNGTYDGNQSLKFGGWRPVANGAEILGNTFQGYMDEMRISDSARYTSAFTPSSSAFTSDANTLLLIHSEEIPYAAGTGSSQLTYSNNTYSNYSGAHNLEIMTKGTDDLSEVSSPSSAPSKGHIEVLINDRLSLSDASSSAHSLTASGDAAISTTEKKIGTHSLVFDGTGDYISIPDHDDFDFSGDFTVELWMYNTVSNSNDHLIGNANHTSGANGGWAVYCNGTGILKFRDYLNGVDTTDFNVGWSANTWHHVCVTRESGTIKVWLDGQLKKSISHATAITGSNVMRIGSDVSTASMYYSGYMDEIRISNVARYTANFTPSTTAFTSDANTKLLISADERYATINTDIKGEMSRDGGTTWSPSTLIRVDKVIAGSYYDVFMGDVDFTGDPSGTNIKGRIKTVNQNQVTVKGMAVNWQ